MKWVLSAVLLLLFYSVPLSLTTRSAAYSSRFTGLTSPAAVRAGVTAWALVYLTRA